MRQTLVLLLLLCSVATGFAQDRQFEKPNYKMIENDIKRKGSDFYYPKLLDRYAQGDTTMTLPEKRHLYYGYTFQPGYSPYGTTEVADSLSDLLQQEALDEADLQKALRLSDAVLAENPFDVRALNTQLYALEKLGKQEAFATRMSQMNTIVDALLSSGDGREKETAFYVTYVAHEYFLLSVLGLRFGGEQSLIDHYDYLKVADNPHGIEGLYFDVSPSLNSMGNLLK